MALGSSARLSPAAPAARTLGARRARLAAIAAAALLAAAAWAWCAHELWRSSVPAGLRMPHVDVHRYFGAAFLRSSASFDRFLTIDRVLASLMLVAVLVVYARRG